MLDFAETLPDQCPPADAADTEWKEIYRMISSEKPGLNAFDSHAALGKVPPEHTNLCQWASCSLLLDVTAKKKLPRLKGHHWAAKLSIPVGAGMSKRKKNHVDFWRGSEFEISSAVLEIVKI